MSCSHCVLFTLKGVNVPVYSIAISQSREILLLSSYAPLAPEYAPTLPLFAKAYFRARWRPWIHYVYPIVSASQYILHPEFTYMRLYVLVCSYVYVYFFLQKINTCIFLLLFLLIYALLTYAVVQEQAKPTTVIYYYT